MFKLQMSVTGLTAARMSLRNTKRLPKADLGFSLKMRRVNLHKKAKCRCFRLVYSSTPVLISNFHDKSIIPPFTSTPPPEIYRESSKSQPLDFDSILLCDSSLQTTSLRFLSHYHYLSLRRVQAWSRSSLATGNGTADPRLRKLPGALGRQLDFHCLGDVRLILNSSAPSFWPKSRNPHDKEFAQPRAKVIEFIVPRRASTDLS
jgi:hypothetical protein